MPDSLPTHISFKAILNSIRTTVDGGWRITLDLSQEEAAQVLLLSQYRNTLLETALIPIPRVRP